MTRAEINPEMLRWARGRSDLGDAELAAKVTGKVTVELTAALSSQAWTRRSSKRSGQIL